MKATSFLMKQFNDLKAKHPDAVLLFRCGDFYETYSDDAEIIAEVLGITLTVRNSDRMKMAGFPYHALDTYLPKLVRAGHRVAICDQIEETPAPKPAPKPYKVKKPTQKEIIAQLQARIKELEEQLEEAKGCAKIELEGAEIRCTKESDKAQMWMKRALEAEIKIKAIKDIL